MRGVRAFTIIEFTIAIAVAMILGAAAISRYNAYLREQGFLSGGQEIANCLQRANTQARASTVNNPPRFVRATISYDASVPKVDCIVEAQPQYRADGSIVTVTQLLQGNPVESTTNQPFRADNTRLAAGLNLRVVFGALENGVPLGLSNNNLLVRQPDNPLIPTSYVPFGSGFVIDASTNTIRLNSDSTPQCGVIMMTVLGAPIHFEPLSSCP